MNPQVVDKSHSRFKAVIKRLRGVQSFMWLILRKPSVSYVPYGSHRLAFFCKMCSFLAKSIPSKKYSYKKWFHSPCHSILGITVLFFLFGFWSICKILWLLLIFMFYDNLQWKQTHTSILLTTKQFEISNFVIFCFFVWLDIHFPTYWLFQDTPVTSFWNMVFQSSLKLARRLTVNHWWDSAMIQTQNLFRRTL